MTAGLVRREIRLAVRRLVRTPGPSLVLLAVLTMGLGANGTLLLTWQRLLGTELPGISEPDRLVALLSTTPAGDWGLISIPDFRDHREQLQSLAGLVGYSGVRLAVGAPAATIRIDGQVVTEGYFALLGVPVRRPGRGATREPFTARDQVVLADSLWRRLFAADPEVVGSTVRVHGTPLTVMGIAPPGFAGTDPWEPAEIWLPLEAHRVAWPHFPDRLLEMRGAQMVVGVGRLSAGTSLATARRELEVVAGNLEPPVPSPEVPWTPVLLPASAGTPWPADRQQVESLLRGLGAAAVLLLLVVILIAAGLAGGRLVLRQREIALRLALGSGRLPLLANLAGEGLVLAVVGGTVGLFLTSLLSRLLGRLPQLASAGPLPLLPPPGIAAAVLALSVATAVTWSIPAAFVPGRSRPSRHLLAAEARGRYGGRGWPFQELLLTVAVALSTILLAAAGWVAASWWRQASLDLGFDAAGVAAFGLDATAVPGGTEGVARLADEVLRHGATLPASEAAALSATLPLGRYRLTREVLNGISGPPLQVTTSAVSAGYFETLRIPLLQGCDFDPASGSRSVILTRSLVTRLWPDGDPVGRTLQLVAKEGPVAARVVGVAADSQSGRSLQSAPQPHMYLFLQDEPLPRFHLLVRSRNGAATLTTVQEGLHRLAPDLAVEAALLLEDHVATATARPRTVGSLLLVAALFAVLLTGAGIFSFVTLVLARTRGEIAVRMVLGADRGSAVRKRVGRSLAFSAAGLVPAVPAAHRLRDQLTGWLPELQGDGRILALVAIVVVAVAVLATYLPARRATTIDPAEVLRTT